MYLYKVALSWKNPDLHRIYAIAAYLVNGPEAAWRRAFGEVPCKEHYLAGMTALTDLSPSLVERELWILPRSWVDLGPEFLAHLLNGQSVSFSIVSNRLHDEIIERYSKGFEAKALRRLEL